MPLVESSAISFVHYDEVAAELHVLFASGRAYVYYGVPRQVYDAMLRASSAGAFFNSRIRDRYRFRRTLSQTRRNAPVSPRRTSR
jgi:hypothetical protein